jgi:uncharacterized protein YcaQ
LDAFDKTLIRAAFSIRQGFDDGPPWATVREAVQAIAAVQIDSISVVARSHHLTLRNRVRDYHPDQLWNALRSRQIFEHFAHACCFVPIEEYPYYRFRMERFSTHCNSWEKNRLHKYHHLLDGVEARIRDEGPLGSKDFQDPSGKKRGGFWDLKPAKVALDLLWQTGRLAIADRQKFQRVYDLTDRVIPSQYLDQQVDQDQVWRHFLERNLDCLVAATPKQLCEYISLGNFALEYGAEPKPRNRTKIMEQLLDQLAQEDKVTRIEVVEEKQQYYVLTQHLPFLRKVQDRRHTASRLWFLNPFDNLVWDRQRVRDLFGMEVRLEAYTPPANRQFGYYITPTLWQHRLVGRIDPKADRTNGTLILRKVEINIPRNTLSEIIEPLREEVERYMVFHELHQLQVNHTKPAKLKAQLEP